MSENQFIAPHEPDLSIHQSKLMCACESVVKRKSLLARALKACSGEAIYIHEGKNFCVAHYPSQNKIEAFRVVIRQKIEIEDFNFCGVYFPETIDFSTYKKPSEEQFCFTSFADFRSATFSGEAHFLQTIFAQKAIFEMTTFEAKTIFSNTRFKDVAYFRSAIFKSATEFISTEFNNVTTLESATFQREVNFLSARFIQKANFSYATFSNKAEFQSVVFEGGADFSETNFKTNANFSNAVFKATEEEASFDIITESRKRGDSTLQVYKASVNFCLANFGEHAKATFISATFNASTSFDGAIFNSSSDFSKVTFASKVYFSSAEFHADAYFEKTTFNSVARFPSSKFMRFTKFDSAKFNADAYFNEATFGNELEDLAIFFSRAEFKANANFYQATFNARTYFESAEFNAEAIFKEAIFGANANFYQATFNALTDFRKATFKGKADFIMTTFGGLTLFFEITSGNIINFTNAQFKDYVRFKRNDETRLVPNAALKFDSLRIEKPEALSFHSTRLRPHWFINSDPRKFEFIEVEWNDDLANEREASKSDRLLSIAYRNLAINAEENHRYDEAMRFRSASMETSFYNLQEKWRDDWIKLRWKNFSHEAFFWWKEYVAIRKFFSLTWWYRTLSKYGESPARAASILFLILFLSAMPYRFVGFAPTKFLDQDKIGSPISAPSKSKDQVTKCKCLSDVAAAFVYSVETASLQKPEPRPTTTLARFFVGLETILAPLQAALLALAIRRKYMR